ncbi:flavin reductase [Methylobacterium brachythecii]|uniref:FMN reductase (NADH) RutF n=1 Tax=Methylobacterium brachythecii TaxID=1176177 RepID=A0A7W6F830_9HYPH|nr:flavin reductase [Methylobacterium brachythecii]MBB3904057.1 flavin reductase [Methylobacterium brachythecii]GLS42797.1 FMN reductase (NADH) RutF [Methylobacterium brachythecii]
MTAIDTNTTALAYRDAMALLASAVHLVTTDGPGGRAGFTASAVCSVSDTPPTLLVCLNRSSSAFAAFSGNTSLCVNTLTAAQRTVADAFGGRTPMAERFAAARWTAGSTGAPVLAGALVSFDCRIVSRTSVATHDVLFCEVIALADRAPNDALVYASRRYYTVPNERTDLRTLRAAERVEGLGNGWAAEARRAALRLA